MPARPTSMLPNGRSAYRSSAVHCCAATGAKLLQRPTQPQLLEEYTKAKDVTRRRLFIETLEGVLGKSNKVIIEGGEKGHGVVPYLILPEIEKR